MNMEVMNVTKNNIRTKVENCGVLSTEWIPMYSLEKPARLTRYEYNRLRDVLRTMQADGVVELDESGVFPYVRRTAR